MKCFTSTVCVLSALVAVGLAAPAPFFPNALTGSASLQLGGSNSGTSGGTSGGAGTSLTDILSGIDIPALLKSVNSIVKLVGVFCPPLSQVLDNVIQNVTSTAFRVFGRIILRGGLGGGGGGSSTNGAGGNGQKVSVVLPTFPPDEDDYDDEDESTPAAGSVDNVDLRKASSSTNAVSSSSTASSNNSQTTTETVSAANEDNAIAKRHVRVVREAEAEDQDGAESAPEPAEDLSNVDEDDADRNKRYSPFGGDGHGGSGNFLFDIIRLVAGSGATEESDEKAHAPGGVAELDISPKGHGDGYTEGIPGPITRLFVIANRGIANLVQDLILRLAQTSERLVNFKARLVTSLI